MKNNFFLSLAGIFSVLCRAALLSAEVGSEISSNWRSPSEISYHSPRSQKALLVPELTTLLDSEKFFVQASSTFPHELSFDENWLKAGTIAQANSLDVGAIQKAMIAKRGPIFGNQQIISQELEERVKVRKILANSEAVWAQQRLVDYNFQLLLLNDNQLQRVQSWRLIRLYPAALGVTASTQLFRESIKILSPASVAGSNWLTLRFIGADEDLEWLYSPAIKLFRQLTASNRADPLLRYDFSADDFFAWSGKSDSYTADLDKELSALVGFETNRNFSVANNVCRGVDLLKLDKEQAPGRWNHSSKIFSTGAAWLPTQSIFVPRPLWRIELMPDDPFVIHGRQVLYIDREMFLPYYKFIYDRSGRLIRTIIASYGFIGEMKTRREPIVSFVLAYSHIRREAAVADTTKVAICEEQQPGMQLSDLEPSKLGPTKPAEVVKPSENQQELVSASEYLEN